MGMSGKILAIANAVLAFAFLVFAGMVYGQRHAWDFAILNQDFVIRGLPVDDKEEDTDGQIRKELIGKELRTRLGLQNDVTQAAAARSRHDQLKTEIAGLQDAAKQKRLEEVVLPLAKNAVERANVRQLIRDQKFDELLGETGPFERAFAETQDGRLAYGLRRQAVGHFLFNTSTTKEDYERTIAVIGLDSYARQVESEAGALPPMTRDADAAIDKERSEFAARQRALVQEIIVLNQQLKGLEEDLRKNQDKLTNFETLVTLRRQDVKDLQTQIDNAQKAAQTALAGQTDLEGEVFQTQKEISDRNAENQKLEGDIKSRELGSEKGK